MFTWLNLPGAENPLGPHPKTVAPRVGGREWGGLGWGTVVFVSHTKQTQLTQHEGYAT